MDSVTINDMLSAEKKSCPSKGSFDDIHSERMRNCSVNISAEQLEEVGEYSPELIRSRSTLQVAFMSFVLAAIPYGLATSLYYPLINGGSATII